MNLQWYDDDYIVNKRNRRGRLLNQEDLINMNKLIEKLLPNMNIIFRNGQRRSRQILFAGRHSHLGLFVDSAGHRHAIDSRSRGGRKNVTGTR